jgi:hypothetical protein
MVNCEHILDGAARQGGKSGACGKRLFNQAGNGKKADALG